jgi:hypothetical protein
VNIWHLTPDAPRGPRRVSPGERVTITVGTWPIEPGQAVAVEYSVVHHDGQVENGAVQAAWRENRGANSYWEAVLGPFQSGAVVTYTPRGTAPGTEALASPSRFRVGPKLYLAILWHQHQPVYRDTAHAPTGSYWRQQYT